PAPGAATAQRSAEGAPLDGVFRDMEATVQDARRRAVAAGATGPELARGDSATAVARRLAARGRWTEAVRGLSDVTPMWMEAERAALTRRTADASRPRTDSLASAPAAPSTLAATPSPPPRPVPAPRETAVAAADPRVEIESLVARYARAIESRSIDALQQAYPGMSAAQRRSWQQFFDDVRDVRASLTIADLAVTGDAATARVAGRYEFTGATTHRPDVQPVGFRATFRRDGGGWRLAAVSQ
ncbi:MAG TPA: hypothetical protein VFS05_14245, partial [Gemmatimonadaceae bacterium]|nr:hypothetical protein [Gemmatimonadaceae bacterium]